MVYVFTFMSYTVALLTPCSPFVTFLEEIHGLGFIFDGLFVGLFFSPQRLISPSETSINIKNACNVACSLEIFNDAF